LGFHELNNEDYSDGEFEVPIGLTVKRCRKYNKKKEKGRFKYIKT
jgi:hypothetical protein